MKSSPLSVTGTLLVGAVCLIVVGAVVVRSTPSPAPEAAVPQSTRSAPVDSGVTATSSPDIGGVPAFTSASFETGDALSSLGPEWTLVQQDPHPDKMALHLAGVKATRDTLVHLINATSSLRIIELQIIDAKALRQSLERKSVDSALVAKTVAGRAGYIVPELSLTGGSAFTLVGTSTAVMLEYAIDPFQNFLEWPKEVPEAVRAYIVAVKVY